MSIRKKKSVEAWRNEVAKSRIQSSPYENIIEWLALPTGKERSENLDLLTEGLPSGSITSAVPLPKLCRIAVIADIIDNDRTKPGSIRKWNTARLFDPETFALMRLLTTYHGSVYLSNRNATDEAKKDSFTYYYPAVNMGKPNDNVTIARLAWGSKTASPVNQLKEVETVRGKSEVGSYYDFGLENLESKETQDNAGSELGPRKRKSVLRAALRYRAKREVRRKRVTSRNEKKLILLTSASAYQAAIQRCYDLLDELKARVLSNRKA